MPHVTFTPQWGEIDVDCRPAVRTSETIPLAHFGFVLNSSRTYGYLVLPNWLLAAVCLAWPVTSFLIARRRRRGRGFAVEAAASGADGEGGVEKMKDEG